MFFNIVADDGDRITGYFVPDTFSGQSIIRITYNDGEPVLLEAQEFIPSLVTAGRHATGQCSFVIDPTVVPDMAQRSMLEIHDPETGLRLYRRRAPGSVVAAKILRLETHLVPLQAFDDALDASFQYYFQGVEQLGQETASQIFLLGGVTSSYVSGRLMLKLYEYYAENNGFRTICLFRDPYNELAERLLVLRRFAEGDDTALDARDSLTFDAAVEFAAALDLTNEKQLRRAFRNMSSVDAMTFVDPLVRSLAARSPGEMPSDSAIAASLQMLSGFAVVGLREHASLFRDSVAALLGVDAASLPAVEEPNDVIALGQQLREISAVKGLIERDLELYYCVKSALEKTL